MASTYYNKTLALTYEESGEWQLALDKDRVLFGTGFGKLLAYIRNNLTCKGKVVIWCYHLSEMVVWAGEENFSEILRPSKKSFKVKKAKIGDNIIFKNLREFYRINLNKIAAQQHIDSINELIIIWNAAEKERLRNEKDVGKIPTTAIGYVARELDKLNGFPRLGASITEETNNLILACKGGGLNGINEGLIDIPTNAVNCYDFKSFYPWIMVSQLFPQGKYAIHKNLSSFGAYKDKWWIARIEFSKIKAKEIDWLKIEDRREVVITSLDFKIIEEDYDFKIKLIKEIIPFFSAEPLPNNLRNLIMKKFNNKEKYAKGSEEYEQAKVFLNSIFGLFGQNQMKYNNAIDCKLARQRPLVIGKFVSAYGRYFLWKVMRNSYPIHWDTDGFKTTKNLDFTLFNQERKIKDSMLGQLMLEEEFAEVTVFGNKQYLLNNKLVLSGTDGDLAKEYCDKIGVKPHCGLTIAAEYTSQVKVINKEIIQFPYTIGGQFNDRL